MRPNSAVIRLIVLFTPIAPCASLFAQDPVRVEVPPPKKAAAPESKPSLELVEPAPVSARDFRLEVLDDEPDFAPMEDVLDEERNIVGVRRVGNPYVLAFTNGSFAPERGVDPRLEEAMREHPAAHTYGFVMIRGRMSELKMRRLRDAGVTLLDVHTYQSFKAKIPARALAVVRGLPFVHWIGYARPAQKIDHHFAPVLAAARMDQALEFTVSPFEPDVGDETKLVIDGERKVHKEWTVVDVEGATSTRVIPNGRFHKRLRDLGFEFAHYNEITHSFTGEMTKARILELLEEDWVHTVELPPGEAVAEHDQAMAQVRQDLVRKSYPGKGVPAGIIDSGIDSTPWHKDFWGMYYVYWGNAIDPTDSHGTHVGGTIWGNGTADKRYTGCAPEGGRGGATNRVFISKWTVADSTNISNFGKSYTDSNRKVSERPAVINCSYSRGSNPNGYYGTDDNTRAFDNAIYNNRQLYVFAAGNKKQTANWWAVRPGVGKNILTVGGVIDKFNAARTTNPGNKYSSGRWGTLDNRTKPEVCAIADALTSCRMDSQTGYSNKSGTSMATPMVTGCLVSRIDATSWYKYRPEALKARAVASAKNRNRLSSGVWAAPQNGVAIRQTTGWGLINSRTMTFATSETVAFTWGGTFTRPGQSYSDTFTVPANAERIRMVLCYTEKAASSGATKARVNDTRSYLDFAPYTGNNTSGDFSALSSRQNVIVRDNIPVAAGQKGKQAKIKVYAQSMPTPNVYWAVVVFVYKRNPTVTNTQILATGDTYVQPNTDYTLTGAMKSLAGSDEFRSGRLWYDGAFSILSLSRRTEDLIDQLYLSTNGHPSNPYPSVGKGGGTGIVVGTGTNRPVKFNLKSPLINGWYTLYVRGTWGSSISPAPLGQGQKRVCVDGQATNAIGGLKSTTHTMGGWSNKDDITFQWGGPTDVGCSGIHGLAWHLDQNATANPKVIDALGAPTSKTFLNALTDTSAGYYFHLRSRDRAGNYGPVAHVGPYKIDTIKPVLTSVVIDDGATATSSLRIKVSVAARDERSGLKEMRFSAKLGVWSAWSPYVRDTRLVLSNIGASGSSGVKTVWVQVRDMAGNVSTVKSDTITYVAVPKITSVTPVQYNNTKGYYLVRGTDMEQVARVRFDVYFIVDVYDAGNEDKWFTGRLQVVSTNELRFYPPQNLVPGTYDLSLENRLGKSSAKVPVKMLAWTRTNNLMNTETKVSVGAVQNILVSLGNNPAGTTQMTMLSGIALPSSIPGFIKMDIGANWTNYFLLPRMPFDATTKNSKFSVKVPPAAKGVTLYFQTLFIGPTGIPLGTSAVRKTTYL